MTGSKDRVQHARVFLDLEAGQDNGQAPVSKSLRWVVPEKYNNKAYVVDLQSFLPRTSLSYVPMVALLEPVHVQSPNTLAQEIHTARPQLLQELAPEIQALTLKNTRRTAFETLSCFRWFFQFLDQLPIIRPELPLVYCLEDCATCGETLGVAFSEWLRRQSISGARMYSLYFAAARILDAASGKQLWRPNPFVRTSSDESNRMTEAQFFALVRMSKQVISEFMQQRRSYQAIRRDFERHSKRQSREHEASYSSRAETYQRVEGARERLLSGEPPGNDASWNLGIAPTGDFVAAIFLLVLCRCGINEQPLIDIQRGQWLASNPFGTDYRTINLWKNRSGSKGATKRTRVTLGVPWAPAFYPARLLRYQELLSGWCLKVMSSTLTIHRVTDRARTVIGRNLGKFWIYWSGTRWCTLDKESSHRLANALIASRADRWPALLGEDGEPIRYSSKAIRDAYLAFVVKWSGFHVTTGQIEIAHSVNSSTIRTYLEKPWARTYVRQSLRELQSATCAVLKSNDSALTPLALRNALGQGKQEGEQELSTLPVVRHGFRCIDALHPPEDVFVPRTEGEACPALRCHDCTHAHCFSSSLPELARDILDLQARCDQTPMHLWQGSDFDSQLRKLQEVFGRFPEKDQAEANTKAQWLDPTEPTYRSLK